MAWDLVKHRVYVPMFITTQLGQRNYASIIKLKVKFSLCLIKYHAMKTYLLLN
jgi:hypothetical protein